MSNEHTPTDEVVKDAATFPRNRLGEPLGIDEAAYDRWKAQVEAAAEQRGAIKALQEAEEVIDAELQDSPEPNYEEDNYNTGRIDGLTFSQELLRNRTDRVADQEGDDD